VRLPATRLGGARATHMEGEAMPFSKRKISIAAGLGVAALGLVGVGTGASFTDSVSTQQQVSAGHMNVQVSTDGSNFSKSAAWSNFGPVGSTFDTTMHDAIIKNSGDIPVTAWKVSLDWSTQGSGAAGDAFANEALVRVTSLKHGGILYDGHLAYLNAHPLTVIGPLAVGELDDVGIEVYAGQSLPGTCQPGATIDHVFTGCPATGVQSLNDDAQGGVITPTVTVDYVG
jgi:predicted ribosomally synthesized peptide with SipW-like signal peptide